MNVSGDYAHQWWFRLFRVVTALAALSATMRVFHLAFRLRSHSISSDEAALQATFTTAASVCVWLLGRIALYVVAPDAEPRHLRAPLVWSLLPLLACLSFAGATSTPRYKRLDCAGKLMYWDLKVRVWENDNVKDGVAYSPDDPALHAFLIRDKAPVCPQGGVYRRVAERALHQDTGSTCTIHGGL